MAGIRLFLEPPAAAMQSGAQKKRRQVNYTQDAVSDKQDGCNGASSCEKPVQLL